MRRNRQSIIEETKRAIARSRSRFLPMTYVLPTEDLEVCATCLNYIPEGTEIIHEMSNLGIVSHYCSEECWLKK